MITCKLGENTINCYDGAYSKEQLKKWAKKNILICPVCNKPYEYCHGEFVSPYFRHKEKNQCEDRYSEPETQEHINGKRDLYEWIKNQKGVSDAMLEGWLPETKQRPDIMFKYNGEQYVIEYQCSPIASEYIERHELYKAGGIKDIWILGTDKYIEKDEIGNKFREKVIESHTNYYYDSEFKLLMAKDLSITNVNVSKIISNNSLLIPFSWNVYKDKQKRKEISSKVIIKIDNDLIADINYLKFVDGFFEINEIGKNLIAEQHYKKDKCRQFINDIISKFNAKYESLDLRMYTMGCEYGFKAHGRYYELCNIGNYPIIDFYKIKYMNNTPKYNLLFNIDIEDKNSLQLVLKHVENDLTGLINHAKYFKGLMDKYKQEYKNKTDRVNAKIKSFINKPIYLLFIEDRIKVPKNIRFKLIHDYYEDELKFGEQLLKDLTFLNKINAKNYTFMIPRKKLRSGTSSRYPYYKVRNYQADAISDFASYGFTVLEYEDLLKQSKNGGVK